LGPAGSGLLKSKNILGRSNYQYDQLQSQL
jgi:hypothetical protein